MTRPTLERLSYIAAHAILNLESQDPLRITAKQFACAGRRRTETVDRIAAAIAETFEGAEQAELASMFSGVPEGAREGR